MRDDISTEQYNKVLSDMREVIRRIDSTNPKRAKEEVRLVDKLSLIILMKFWRRSGLLRHIFNQLIAFLLLSTQMKKPQLWAELLDSISMSIDFHIGVANTGKSLDEILGESDGMDEAIRDTASEPLGGKTIH